jgi:hypothetical protein
MATRQQLETALRNADKAGNTEDARRLAAALKALGTGDNTAAQDFASFASKVTTDPTAMAASTAEQQRLRDVSEYENLPGWQKPLVAAQDIVGLMGTAPLLGYGEKIAAALQTMSTGGPEYERALIEERRNTAAARNRSGWAGTTGEIAANIKALPSLIGSKMGWLTGGAVGAAEGAGYGAIQATGEDTDIGTGALYGGGGGAVGSAVGNLLAKGGPALGRAWNYYLADPSDKAAAYIANLARQAGIGQAEVDAAIREHGDELMTMELFGSRGTAAGRAAANVSPEARDVMVEALEGRKAGMTNRVTGTLEEMADLPPGGASRHDIPEFKEEAYSRQRPAIDAAYEEARAAGYDLPREPFRDILETPMGRKAYDQAAVSLKNRVGVEGVDAASELGRLDQTVRELDSIANVAYRQGDRETGSLAANMARTLKQRMDESIAGPEYQEARRLGRERRAREGAIDLGAEAAAPRVSAGTINRAAGVTDADLRQGMGMAYAVQQAENLANKGSTEGVISLLNRPAQRRAISAVFGDNAELLRRRLATERMFNRTNREITGNSTTARQLLEAGLLGGGGQALDYLDLAPQWLTQGMTGIGAARLGITGLRAGRDYLRQRGVRDIAPAVAESLSSPAAQTSLRSPIPEHALERIPDQLRDMLTRLITQSNLARNRGEEDRR